MLRYKLIDQAGYTRRGHQGESFWLDGLPVFAKREGKSLCTNGVVHFCDTPLLAVLLNPLCADIDSPRLIEVQTTEEVAHDGLKGGCKSAQFVRELPVPALTPVQYVAFAILAARLFPQLRRWTEWADNYLSGKDRSVETARAIASEAMEGETASALAAAWAAAAAAQSAARAAWAAAAAARSAARAAAVARVQERIAWEAWAGERVAWPGSGEADIERFRSDIASCAERCIKIS